MRVAVISDTHVPAACAKLPEKLTEQLEGCDLIIHAGDMTEDYVFDALKEIANIEAVSGNMDSLKIKKLLPERKILELEGFKIGVIHGFGPPDNIINYVQEKFKDEECDCIIYGHSHRPAIDKIGNTVYFNPGSPTEKVFAPYNSFGILEINDKELKPEIIRL